MRVLMIIGKDYDDEEGIYPFYRLLEAGVDVDVASFEKEPVLAKYHAKINANLNFSEVDADLYDGLVLPGGKAPEKLRLNDDVLKITEKIFRAGKPVAAICHGQQILISADVLRGKKATSYPGIRKDMENAGAMYLDQPVVIDENLITSRRPEDLPYFMRAYMDLLEAQEK